MSTVFDPFPVRPRHAGNRSGVPGPPSEVPPRRSVPPFPPVRAGCGNRHRLRQAVRCGPGPLAAGVLAAATALAFGPLREPPAAPPGRVPPAGAVPHCAPSGDGGVGHDGRVVVR
ncbi:hypothetical protein [Peterkaempfera bronchialis]|uniref:Uncharacterized protein n=1 Tax=Peterkaempfera bronchialis TaxID=2126346 RepID=A0A345SZF1_9ACTN|nr:hypothetical protein [Peterkaempfera bronchialis]AXI79106.1 hypothetical protein C7M71_018470 [Peterkaempfera bronchialis]